MISSDNGTVNSNLGCHKNIAVTEYSSIIKRVDIDDNESDKRPDIFSECRWDHQYSSGGEFFKVVFINVWELLSKLNFPDFIDFIAEYDLICICESKLDDADVHNVDLDGYHFIPYNRKKYLRKSGGIGIFVKNELIDNSYISFPKKDVQNIILLYFLN